MTTSSSSVTMGSSKFFFVLILLFNCSVLNAGEDKVVIEKEVEAQELIAENDTRVFNEQMKVLGDDYGKTWIVMADGNGLPVPALLEDESPKYLKKTFFIPWSSEKMPDMVKLYLYTKKNPEGQKFLWENLQNSGYNSSKTTKVIIHGWMASSESSIVTSIRDAYLDKQDVNIIAVDWNAISKDVVYSNCVAATEEVGHYVGDVINTLVEENGAKYSDFHIVGHSLGAHVSGYAGQTTNEKIGRITGLDPALPGFQYTSGDANRLDSSDANFVDVIHTCSGVLGMSSFVGHADFYPNGGSPFQPGCSSYVNPPGTQSCSHSRSHQFFAESIKHPEFKAVSCDSWNQFKKNDCNNIYADMGEYVSPNANGTFYLATGSTYPFAKGINGTIYT